MVIHADEAEFVETKTPVQADDRGRITLGKQASNKQYSVRENARGELLLTPVVSIPAHEAWLYNNPQALASVRKGLADAAAGRVHDLGSFAEFADLEIDE